MGRRVGMCVFVYCVSLNRRHAEDTHRVGPFAVVVVHSCKPNPESCQRIELLLLLLFITLVVCNQLNHHKIVAWQLLLVTSPKLYVSRLRPDS